MSTATARRSVPSVFAIERRPASLTAEVPKHVTDQISALLRAQLADLTAGEDEGTKPSKSISPFAPAAPLESHIAEWKKNQILTSPTKLMDFTIPMGTRVIGPPYDHSWTVGAAGPLPRFDGYMFVLGDDGFSADGVSIMLSSPSLVLASVTPMGTYDFSWTSFDNYPNLRSRGGLGILVYGNGDPNPLVVRQAVLWTLSGVSQFSGNKGSGQFADAVAVMTDFGPIPLAPVLFNMNPGATYEVWMWCWQVAQNEKGTAFLNALQSHMPAVLIDAGPPIVIH
jgi:hypothetical protein